MNRYVNFEAQVLLNRLDVHQKHLICDSVAEQLFDYFWLSFEKRPNPKQSSRSHYVLNLLK